MNIFILDSDQKKAVEYLCDKHVVKMVLETAQLLCSPFLPATAPYKRTHYNHPCSRWTRASIQNYSWLLKYGNCIAQEYCKRFGRRHKSADVIEWCDRNQDKLNLPDESLTSFAQAMPDKYKDKCAITAYRAYYIHEKAYMAKWERTDTPNWWTTNLI